MRDLTSRLREIVKRERAAAGASGSIHSQPVRELTYIPDTDNLGHSTAAAQLGGAIVGNDEGCVAVERCYPWHSSHGRRRVESYSPEATAPLNLLDSRFASNTTWADRVVFFDLETTGLSGGAGTLAFLVGCGWFAEEGFIVRQFFLASPAGERSMLKALADIFANASLVVTFNGRTFDLPLIETRWAFHRETPPTDGLSHFDMLPAARRLWGRRNELSDGDPTERTTDFSCRLSALERSVLGFHRVDDVPGFEVPARYFHYLRTGDASGMWGVLEHNQHDLMSLAAVMSHALWLVREGPDACREPAERLALGRIYERAGRLDAARGAFESAAVGGDVATRRHALARLGLLFRRSEQYDAAAAAWQGVLDLKAPWRSRLSSVERRAAEALAIHHEHRARNPETATRYATLLERASVAAPARADALVRHRLDRLRRKTERQNEKDGPKAVPLLEE